MALQYKASEHYDAAPQIFPEIKGDKLSSLECRTFRKFITLYSTGMHIVDLGCGTGRVSRYLSYILQPSLCIALESSIKELILTRELGSGAAKNFHIRGDVLHLPLKRIKYCVCHGVIHHTPDPDLAIKEIASAIVSGGFIYLTVYSKSRYSFLYAFLRYLEN